MATKPKSDKVAADVQADSRRSNAGDAPFADPKTNPEEGRDKQVVKEPAKSFDERTATKSPVEAVAEPEDN